MYTPHTNAAPTLGVRTNMLPFRSMKNSAPTLGVDKKCMLAKNTPCSKKIMISLEICGLEEETWAMQKA